MRASACLSYAQRGPLFSRLQPAAPTGRAVGIGISAPQGCGKTTLVDTLVGRFAADGLAWHVQRDPVDVLLFEGWMAGFAPAGDAARLAGLDPDLALVDSFLRGYAEWHDKMDAWAVIGIDDLSHVCAWRTQAEQAMAAAGRPGTPEGMDDAAVADFVSRYLPAYRAYLPALYTAAQAGGVGGKPTLLARVDGSRRVVPTAELGAPSG
ncbi:hypothetical protein EMIHUDRAFT_247483 [Emiliania huxleyi CCMP1516]|uniref:Deoxynucleoside kinase domain-containing protein n=2 Tax=Emiliania huxleyi TaxID=2903 RepID=A0A0D3I5N4_EMIH1|nr:hypothetical protein EMIHUDRAFT_219082 [Emiliania huxleyi CCMP1516]XP_005764731.1 hypothetical protein EMIHUDRAFT_247483 [Emiliania huxleyi CCMP1516]EOD06569.1 hypothetical protein EMIHUDRAFT_219082 [Emiliania huxleyi CCMP1516]EOD12302.1 hypothetical protein EMIHUDRAFT_247483 [Emiliania huxleyi CCMP1516]|eukprot:XP_005758998.1 hypothetical protein EMIHUDRAFT_219082 [Emiliania huxleyi CCMP1516]